MDFEFDLDTPAENLDTVPKHFHHMFEQGDDGFKLTDTSRPVAEQINALGANLKNSRTTKKQASDESAARRQKLTAIETALKESGFDGEELTAESINEFISGLGKASKADKDAIRESLNKQKAEMERAKAEAVSSKDEEIKGMQSSLEKYLLNSAATSAIAEHKGVPDLLMPFVKQQSKVVKLDNGEYAARVVDADGEIRYNGKGNPMEISELVETMKADVKYGRLFDADVPTGGGAQSQKKPVSNAARQDDGDKNPTSKIAAGLSKLKRGR